MRKTFTHYYRPTEEEFKTLWDKCIFSFDTNVLLDVYRYTEDTRNRLIEVMEHFRERIWIPYQVGDEFHRNRPGVVRAQEIPYEQILSKVIKSIDALKDDLRSLNLGGKKPHPFIVIQKIYEILDHTVQQVEQALTEMRDQHPKFLQDDPLLQKLTTLFDGKVGTPYPEEELDAKYDEIKERYALELPPGYKDLGDKPAPTKGDKTPRAYGDAIVWFQIIDYAAKVKRPIILVTGEIKEDWWLKVKGMTVGPRPELVNEMLQGAGVAFYLYSTDVFLERAEQYLGLETQKEAIGEIRELRKQHERDASEDATRLAEAIVQLAHSQKETQQVLAEMRGELEGRELYVTEGQSIQLSQMVKALAQELSKRSGRNEYGAIYGELYRRFGITSYKLLPRTQFKEAISWLENWHQSLVDDSNG